MREDFTWFPGRPVPLVRVAGLAPFVAYLGRTGAPLHGLLARVGLPARVFARPEGLIPSARRKAELHEAEEEGPETAYGDLYDVRREGA